MGDGKHVGVSETLAPLYILLPPIVLVLLAVVMLILTIRYLIISGRLDPASIPLTCRYQRDQLKYLAILSLATGALGAVYTTVRAFVHVAIAGSFTFDKVSGPLSYGLIHFGLGLLVFMMGIICMIVVLARSSRLIAAKGG